MFAVAVGGGSLQPFSSTSDKAERSFRSLAIGKRRVPETNPLRETVERFSWTKPLSSLCRLIQFGKQNRRTEITREGMTHTVEFIKMILMGRTLEGFAGIGSPAAFEIRHRIHGAGKLRVQKCVGKKIEAADFGRRCIVMTNRSRKVKKLSRAANICDGVSCPGRA